MAASYSLTSSIYVNINDLEPGRSSFGVKVRVIMAKLSTRRMDFKIANTQGRELGCSLWSEYIDPVLAIFEKEDNRPIIICIQFGKITRIFATLSMMVPEISGSRNNGIAEEFHEIYALFKNNAAQVMKISTLTALTERPVDL
ncbi:hypothetical protein CASFOL_022345 [Castilleja foliolosa]|uniref:Uncharacterized protein n=1 Tax=Castilleja foliolosa TaxID=1961234 RepID=A0ABD3CUB8_9LAMI